MDRIEINTGPFAWAWGTPEQDTETRRVYDVARRAQGAGLGVNAGHDQDRHNLVALQALENLDEVSIGHAQIVRALDVGTTRSVQELLQAMGWPVPAFG